MPRKLLKWAIAHIYKEPNKDPEVTFLSNVVQDSLLWDKNKEAAMLFDTQEEAFQKFKDMGVLPKRQNVRYAMLPIPVTEL